MSQSSIQHPSSSPPLILRPTRGWAALNLGDLWAYRELIYFLTLRDIKVRYKQTALGALWAILQPFLQMVVFTLLFGNLAQMDSEGIPYPIFTYTALLPWGMFSKAITDAGRSIVLNRSMITKIYFPRLVVPLASGLAGLVDFGIAFLVLIGMMLYFSISFSPAILTLPLFLLLALLTALGVGLWLSSLNVIYRDFGYVIPFLTQLWFFATPIVYSADIVPEKWQLLYSLNPMVSVVEGFRWALLGAAPPSSLYLGLSAGIAVLMFFSGVFYFRRMERTFADTV
jgi:homopolymeric O-antigen transport system permease protein